MSEQFTFSFEDHKAASPEEQTALTQEILNGWTPQDLNEKYRQLIGQRPKAILEQSEVIKGILDPGTERQRVLAENREEDRNDHPFSVKK